MNREVQPLINVPEAAELLRISVNTLRQWISQRKVPTIKLGKAVRFSPDDLRKLIEESRREAVNF
jgi:excisionase family DNA binding protein